MALNQQAVTDFRKRLREVVETDREAWAASRRLVDPSLASGTIQRLEAAVAGSALDPGIREKLLLLLSQGREAGLKTIPSEALRELTGLNPTKAIRNLCLLLGVAGNEQAQDSGCAMTQEAVEGVVRGRENPFDVLLETESPSVVDCGAGDLTFEENLVGQYLSRLEQGGRDLILHAFDRLDPQARFGGLVQAEHDRLEKLRRHPSSHLKFRLACGARPLHRGGLPQPGDADLRL